MSGLAACNRAHDRREVGGARRIGPVIDDLEAELLGVGRARPRRRCARTPRPRPTSATVVRLRILLRRDLEEAFGERRLGVRSGRDHREVLVGYLNSVFTSSPNSDDEHLVLLHHDRHGRRDHVGGVAADDEIDLVDVEQLGVDARHGRGIALVVVEDELDRTPEQTALGVDFLFPDLHAEQRLLAVGGERAGQRHAEADRDRLARLGARRRGERRRQRERASGGEGKQTQLSSIEAFASSQGEILRHLRRFIEPRARGRREDALPPVGRLSCPPAACPARSLRRVAGIDHDGLDLARAASTERGGLVVFVGLEAGHALLEARKFDHDEAVEFVRALP